MKRVEFVKERENKENTKYIFLEQYKFAYIYQEVSPSGYHVSQSYMIMFESNETYNADGFIRILIPSYSNKIKEELLDMIDNKEENGKFGLRVFDKDTYYVAHFNGDCII